MALTPLMKEQRLNGAISSTNLFTCKCNSTCWTQQCPCAFVAILTKVWHLTPKHGLASIVTDKNQYVMVIISVNHLMVYTKYCMASYIVQKVCGGIICHLPHSMRDGYDDSQTT